MISKIIPFFFFLVAFTLFLLLDSQNTSAFDGDLIQPAESLPATTPWNLKKLSKPPKFEWGDGSEVRSLYFESEKHQGRPTRIFAYYATPGSLANDPAKDKNLPAVVLVHGGGGKAFEPWVRLWAKRGYAAIAMDLSGSRPNSGPDQSHVGKFGTISEPISDQWTYHAVANVIRAHSLIRSFPEVDAKRTALSGISWGGYLTCIVAGLDNRFQAAVPVYGCGFLYENSSWLSEFAKMTPEQKTKWITLWDPSQYVGSTTVPMLFVNGGRDFHYPPDSYAKTYALVKSAKNICFSANLPHGHIFDRPKAIELFINHYTKGGVPLPLISLQNKGKLSIEATVKSETELTSAQLYYSTDAIPGDNKKRTWTKLPAKINQNQITCELPPENTIVWFLTIKDKRNAMVSSRLVFTKNVTTQR